MTTNTTHQQYSLHENENYKDVLHDSEKDIIEKYIFLMCEYFQYSVENTNNKEKTYYKFILVRGMETIHHVFYNILLYTKNLDVSYFNSQKAFYYYVEFIDQISDSQHSFLQLSSKDAVMYVYKKTLFEINHEKRKNRAAMTQEEQVKMDSLQHVASWYKNVVSFMINDNSFFLLNEKNTIYEVISRIKELFLSMNESNNVVQKYWYDITLQMNEHSLDIVKYINILSLLYEKSKKMTPCLPKSGDDDYSLEWQAKTPEEIVSLFFI